MQSYISYLLAFLIFITVLFIVYQRKQTLTSKRFLITTYSYIVLAILLTWILLKILDSRHYIPQGSHLLIAFIVMLVAIFGCRMTSVGPSHIFWLLLIIASAITLYPVYTQGKINNRNTRAVGMILCITLIVGFLVSQNIIDTSKWGTTLLTLLWILIFAQIGVAFWGGQQAYKYTLILGTLLFIALLLYDSQNLVSRSHSIVNSCNNQSFCSLLNYPFESLSIFLDIINLYVRATQR